MTGRKILVAALLALHIQLSSQQTCGSLDVKGRGAKGNGLVDDSAAFLAIERDATTGTIYVPEGTYRISQTIYLTKPIIAADGSVFKIDANILLQLANQPEHPYTTFFTGAGTVLFGGGTHFIFAEWFGAAQGAGITDDADAIEKAYTAAIAASAQPMVYLRGVTYGLGRELRLPPAATIVSEDAAKLVSVNNNPRGLTLTKGNWGSKHVLPSFDGFSDFCLNLEGVELASLHLKTLSNCGDAIRLSNAAFLDGVGVSTVWFDKIINAVTAIAFRFPYYAVVQGNHIVGNLITGGPSSRDSYSILMSSTIPNGGQPAWDSNNFDILRIEPPAGNANWRMFRATPRTDKQHIKIGVLAALSPGQKVFHPEYNSATNSYQGSNFMFPTIKLEAPLPEGGWGPLVGELSVYEVSGATTPANPNTPVRIGQRANSQATFNGGHALVGNFHTLLAVPEQDWAPGTVQIFYFYHQFANSFTYQLKCNSPANTINCVQMDDNALSSPGQLVLYLINNSGGTVQANTGAIFTISLFTLGPPS